VPTGDLREVSVFDPDVYANGDPGQNGLPIELFARLRNGAPCVRLPCDIPGHEKSAWVLSRYEDVSTMLREPDHFLSGSGVTMRATHTTVSEDGGKPAMITMDGAAHVRNRRLVNRGFTPAVVRRFEAHFRMIAGDIVQRAVDLGAFDFYGNLVSARSQTFKLTVTPAQYTGFYRKPLNLSLAIDLPRGQLALRAGVFDTAASKAGTLEIPLTIPKK